MTEYSSNVYNMHIVKKLNKHFNIYNVNYTFIDVIYRRSLHICMKWLTFTCKVMMITQTSNDS